MRRERLTKKKQVRARDDYWSLVYNNFVINYHLEWIIKKFISIILYNDNKFLILINDLLN